VPYFSVIAILDIYGKDMSSLSTSEMISVALGIIFVLTYILYIIFGVAPYRIFELYKINNFFRLIGLVLLVINKNAGVVSFNIV